MSDPTHTPAADSAVREPRANIRRNLIGAALSSVVPGTGQLFQGRQRKACVLFLLLILVSISFWPLRLPRSYPGLLALLWMCLLLSLFAVLDALFNHREKSSARLSRWWILLALPLAYASVNLIFTSLLLGSGFRAMTFASSAMEPTIPQNRRFIFDSRYYNNQLKHRGDLIVMRHQGSLTVKRIAAVAGDRIEGKDWVIILNGKIQNEPYMRHVRQIASPPELETFQAVVIPAGKYFVIGDNRDTSLDSRSPGYGLVDDASIVGKPLYWYQLHGHPLSQDIY